MPPRKKQADRDKIHPSSDEYVALGAIQHGPPGEEGEDTLIELEAGDFLPAGKFTTDEIEALLDHEAIAHKDEFGRSPLDVHLDQREAELQEREAALAAREAALAAESAEDGD